MWGERDGGIGGLRETRAYPAARLSDDKRPPQHALDCDEDVAFVANNAAYRTGRTLQQAQSVIADERRRMPKTA